MLVKKGRERHRRWQPQGPEGALTSQRACDALAQGSSYRAAELRSSLRALSSELSPFVGALLPPPRCPCISHRLTMGEEQPQGH